MASLTIYGAAELQVMNDMKQRNLAVNVCQGTHCYSRVCLDFSALSRCSISKSGTQKLLRYECL